MAYEISARVKAFIALIENYDYSIDDGPIPVGLTAEINTSTEVEPDDVALTTNWTDDEGLVFEESFTYAEIDNATTDGVKINLTNTEGAPASFRFYQLTPAPFDASQFGTMNTRKPG